MLLADFAPQEIVLRGETAIKINDGDYGQHLSERDQKGPNSPSKKLAVLGD
jgi:hypothetical protein